MLLIGGKKLINHMRHKLLSISDVGVYEDIYLDMSRLHFHMWTECRRDACLKGKNAILKLLVFMFLNHNPSIRA